MSPLVLRFAHKKIKSGEVKIDQVKEIWCLPLGPLLNALGLVHVNWWILDVEGAEL